MPEAAVAVARPVSRFAEINAKAVAEGKAEAFYHPRSFAEFFDQNPGYVRAFLRSRHCKCPLVHLDDFENSLLLHLMTPPGVKSPHFGKSDLLATYEVDKHGGYGTRWAWANYLKIILLRKYVKLIAGNERGGVRGKNVVSLTDTGALGATGNPDIPQILRNQDDRQHFMCDPADGVSRVFMEKFLAFAEIHGEENVVRYLRAVVVYDTPKEVRAALGLSVAEASAIRATAQDLLRRYRHRGGKFRLMRLV